MEGAGVSDTRRRFPASLFADGREPDPRFTLANERTFLAWIGAALALIAAGVALDSLGLQLNAPLRIAASVLLVLAGIATPVQAWLGWYRTERALREDRPLPSPFLMAPIAIVVVAAGVLVALAILLR
jgi:putative membrane protein